MDNPTETATDEPLAAPGGVLTACDYCGAQFRQYRPNQRFCQDPCRRAFEKIIARVGSRLHGLIRAGVVEIMRARAKTS